MQYITIVILVVCMMLGVIIFFSSREKKGKILALLVAIASAIGAVVDGADISQFMLTISGDTNLQDLTAEYSYGPNTTILYDQDGIDNKVINQYYSGMSDEQKLLEQGIFALKSGDYDLAYECFSDDLLIDNEYAKINIAYMLSHGYGTNQDVDKAIKIYSSIGTDSAKRNLLGTLIASNHNGDNNDKIADLIDYFLDNKDRVVCDYLSHCLMDISFDSLVKQGGGASDLRSITWDRLYRYELTDESTHFSNPPRNTGYQIYIFIGANYEEDDGSLPSYYYETYDLMYINILDSYVS